MERVEVWIHEKTGEFFLVGNEGATVFGPVAAQQILRQYRCAIEPHEDILRIPCFYETFRTFRNPHPLSEYCEYEVESLPPSVTEQRVPDDIHAAIDWHPRLAHSQVEEARRLASTADGGIDVQGSTIGQLTSVFKTHPKGTLAVCRKVLPGEIMLMLEWA